MPYKPNSPCSFPGCTEKQSKKDSFVRYCGKHQRFLVDKYVSYRPHEDRIHSSQWISLSKQLLSRYPVCQSCGRRRSQQVDHIVPRSFGGLDSLNNLQVLCSNCHGSKTMKENRFDSSFVVQLNNHRVGPRDSDGIRRHNNIN